MKSYLAQSTHSSPGRYSAQMAAFPEDIEGVVKLVRGLLLHTDQLALYGLDAREFSAVSRETLPLGARFDQISDIRDMPLSESRIPSERAIGTCRDFALMTCGILREKGIPARVRCGFARYFVADKFEDHWICEAWQSPQKTWRQIDAQLDEAHQRHFAIGFDTTRLPEGAFLTSAEAWNHYRNGACEASSFGHGGAVGAWFLWVNLARDLMSLTGRETSEWDGWRDIPAEGKLFANDGLDACDQLARAIRELEKDGEARDPSMRPRPFWKSQRA